MVRIERVDADVHVLPADAAAAVSRAALVSPIAGDAMASAAADPVELLDVDVNELAWTLALVAIRRLGRLEPRQPAEVESG
jgi:hypothetical protein